MGLVLVGIGVALYLGAMLSATANRRWQVWFRGSFQRREDYTRWGWRVLWIGLICYVLGIALAVLFADH